MDEKAIDFLDIVLLFEPIGNKRIGKEMAMDPEDQDDR